MAKPDNGGKKQLVWNCGQCKRKGTATVWRRPGETCQALATRHQRETRTSCVDGCTYSVVSVVP